MQKKNIALAAPLTSYSGYGQYGRAIALMLIDSYKDNEDISIFLFDLTGNTLADVQKFELKNSKHAEIKSYVRSAQDIEKQFFDIFMTVSVPQAFLQKGLINIGITALAEVDKVHPQLIEHCNRMDEIIVMSQFNIDSLNRSIFRLADNREIKINVPISVLPSPFIDIDANVSTDITEYINAIPQKFLFLSVGQWLPGNIGSDRKDIGALISAFLRGFPNNKDIGLLLKVDQGRSTILSQYVMKQRINEICKGIGVEINTDNIYFISGHLTESQIKQIYANDKVKALVSFTHGQSYGIPIMEFIGITGKPTLIPYHSGMLEYIKPEHSEILIHKQTQVPKELFQSFYRDFMIPESRWYTVDYQYALFKMADVITNYNSVLVRSKKHQEHIKETFNITVVSETLKKILNKYIIQNEEF